DRHVIAPDPPYLEASVLTAGDYSDDVAADNDRREARNAASVCMHWIGMRSQLGIGDDDRPLLGADDDAVVAKQRDGARSIGQPEGREQAVRRRQPPSSNRAVVSP